MPITRSDTFNKNLEAQQNVVAGYDPAAQLAIIEDLMLQEVPWPTVLRSLVLMSLTSGGIKPKVLEGFKRDFLQTYGYHHLPLLVALQDLNLLVKAPNTAPQPFPSLRKPLRLIVDDIDDAAPNDISYVYSGYAPLSIRLVQCVTQKNSIMAGAAETAGMAENSSGSKREIPKAHPIVGWRGFEDVLGCIPGATVDVRQKSEDSRRDNSGFHAVEAEIQPLTVLRIALRPESTATTVVFFIGGCTYAEVAALRWMSKQTKGRRFLIATTGIITGSSVSTCLAGV